jgi:uroporphyrinogen decarboxylase
VVIPYLGIFLRDHWEEVTDELWWSNRDGSIQNHLRVARDLYAALDIDWVAANWGQSRQWREQHSVIQKGENVLLVDEAQGSETEIFKPPPGGEVNVIKCRVHSKDDVDSLIPSVTSESLLSDGSLDLAQAMIEEFGDGRFTLGSVGSPLWSAYSYFGFEELMMNLMVGQELLIYFLEKVTANTLERIRALAAAGVDGVWIEDCYASKDIISVEHFREFAVPGLRQVIDTCRELDLPCIHYFCGDVSDRLVDLVDLGPDGLSLEESKKGFRIEMSEIDESVGGRTCLLGNIDPIGVLQKGSREEMAQSLEEQAAIGRRSGRFIVSVGSPVTPLTSTGKLQEFLALAREAVRP